MEMPLYGGIDLHAKNSVVVLLNEQDHVVSYQRFNNGSALHVMLVT
jgi:hypothetical protein